MIYFIKSKQLVKIGYSKNPTNRLKELQTGSASKLSLWHTMPGSYQTEAGLHELFKKNRRHGEWFKLDRKLRFFIQAAIANPECTNIHSLQKLALERQLREKAKRLHKKGNSKLLKRIAAHQSR